MSLKEFFSYLTQTIAEWGKESELSLESTRKKNARRLSRFEKNKTRMDFILGKLSTLIVYFELGLDTDYINTQINDMKNTPELTEFLDNFSYKDNDDAVEQINDFINFYMDVIMEGHDIKSVL